MWNIKQHKILHVSWFTRKWLWFKAFPKGEQVHNPADQLQSHTSTLLYSCDSSNLSTYASCKAIWNCPIATTACEENQHPHQVLSPDAPITSYPMSSAHHWVLAARVAACFRGAFFTWPQRALLFPKVLQVLVEMHQILPWAISSIPFHPLVFFFSLFFPGQAFTLYPYTKQTNKQTN